MKKIALMILALLSCSVGRSCTLFWASKNEQILCAKNMDWFNTDARMLFLPPEGEKLGRVYIGVESTYGFTNTSGMNEAGLWYGGASLPPRSDVYNTYQKPEWEYELIEKVMEECTTVEQALRIFSVFWEPHWNGHSLLADRFGNCALVYYGEDDASFIKRKDTYQVITNFYLSDTINMRWHHCHRFERANSMLDTCQEISFSLFRQIADHSHAEGLTHPTVLTTIHDLKMGVIELYYMHNFEELIRINLSSELKKGKQYIQCSRLFSGIKLKAPLPESELKSNKVLLEWMGDEEQYLIRYSEDPTFQTFSEIEYCAVSQEIHYSCINAWILIFLVPLCLLSNPKISRCILFVSICLFASCEPIEIQPQYSTTNHSLEIELAEDTPFYWKVISVQNEYASESLVWTFTTGYKWFS